MPHYRLFKRVFTVGNIKVSFYRFSRFIGNFAAYNIEYLCTHFCTTIAAYICPAIFIAYICNNL